MFDKIGVGLSVVILLMLVLIIILTVITISVSMRMSRLTRKYKIFMKGSDGLSLESAMQARFEEVDHLLEASEEHTADIHDIKSRLGKTLTHYGIVKYDAFDDVGGRMSFVLAMLDNDNTGFILDTIHSRDNCFTYIKEIVKGESYIMLSREETQALKQAVNDLEEEDFG